MDHPDAMGASRTGEDDAVRREQVRLTYQNIRHGWLGILVQGGLIEYGARQSGVHTGFWSWWWVGVAVVAVLHGALVRAFFRADATGEIKVVAWERGMALTSFLAGGAASIGVALFCEPDADGWPYYLIAVLVMPGFGSAVTSGASSLIHTSWVAGSILPAASWFLLRGGIMGAFGVAMLVGSVAMLAFGMGYGRIYRRNITLYIHNLALTEQLRRKIHVAEAANQEKSRFLAAVSHDLRQPLHALDLFHGSLASRLESEEQRELLELARQSSRSLAEMLGELMDVARLDAGKVVARRRRLRLAPLMRECVEELRPLAANKGLSLHLRVPPTVCVETDAVLLKRILRNLLANAIQHTETGGVLVGARRRGDRVRIEVHDTGPGIDEESLGRVFDEFYQVHNPERDREKGLGLGLAIVRRLAGLLGCEVEARSRPGKGSCFTVAMPVCEAPAPCGEADDVADGASLVGLFVVVVDDDRAILEGMRRLLRGWGCEVLLAEGSRALLEELGGRDYPAPDWLICDYRLRGGETGLDVVAAVRRHFGAPVPAAIVSGDVHPEVREAAQAADCVFVEKPIEEGGLRRLLASARG